MTLIFVRDVGKIGNTISSSIDIKKVITSYKLNITRSLQDNLKDSLLRILAIILFSTLILNFEISHFECETTWGVTGSPTTPYLVEDKV